MMNKSFALASGALLALILSTALHAQTAPQPTTTPAAGAQPTQAQRLMGDVNPKLAELTDNVLFGDVRSCEA